MIELMRVSRLTVTSMPYDLPGMFPNRFAWPPDLPIWMFCEPETCSGELLTFAALTTSPAGATPRDRELVRRTTLAALPAEVLRPGSWAPACGNGVELAPTLLLSVTAPVSWPVAWIALSVLSTVVPVR